MRDLVRTIQDITVETFRRWFSDGVFTMSAAIAFYATFAAVPGLLIFMAVVGLVYGNNTASEIEQQVSQYVGDEAGAFVTAAVLVTTDRIAFVRTSPIFVEAALTSPHRDPSGILNRCSQRLRNTSFSFSENERPCCFSSSAIASSASHSHWSLSRL